VFSLFIILKTTNVYNRFFFSPVDTGRQTDRLTKTDRDSQAERQTGHKLCFELEFNSSNDRSALLFDTDT